MGFVSPKACAVCGAAIDGDHDLEEGHQRLFTLHLQACSLAVEKEKQSSLVRIANSLDEIARLMRASYREGG